MLRAHVFARFTLRALVLFGFCLGYIDMVAASTEGANDSAEVEESTEKPPDDGQWVEVEPTNLLPSDITGIYYLIPYRNRRTAWGYTVSFGYSSFKPINYEPNFIALPYGDVYSTAELPLVELQYSIKRNFVLGSIGVELGVGMYQNESDSELIESDVRFLPVRLGLNLALDNLTFEPFVVPYAMGGVYTIFYDEKVAGTSFGGNTEVAPYLGFGVAVQLNWVDREAARISYMESGIENTFLYAEVREFLASQAAKDPDFSTGFDWGAGVRLEF